MLANSKFKLFAILCSLILGALVVWASEDINPRDLNIPVKIRFIRSYGGNDEKLPPIILLQTSETKNYPTPLASEFVTIEFDVSANTPPRFYAQIVHCGADWSETENVFVNSFAMKTSNIDWTSSLISNGYFTHRGKFQLPNAQFKFKFSGNYKVKIVDYTNDSTLAETRLFVVKPKAQGILLMNTDLYESQFKISKTSLFLQSTVATRENLIESNMGTTVFYKNHRWLEPWICSNNENLKRNTAFRYKIQESVSGFASFGKNFRIENLPAENGYRILDLTNTTFYRQSNALQRINFSEIPRNGSFLMQDDDGAMVSANLGNYFDDYVYTEFILDPINLEPKNDVFVTGSFNNWKPNKDWQMFFDNSEKLYKLRQWVRRGRHNYLFTTGTLDYETNTVKNYSNDEFEGNTSYTGHTYIAMTYYREIEDGGYESLVCITASTIYGSINTQ